MATSKLVEVNEKIAERVVGGHKKVAETVVGGYKKIEDAFVARYLTHDGETVEEAKARIHAQQENNAPRHRTDKKGTRENPCAGKKLIKKAGILNMKKSNFAA